MKKRPIELLKAANEKKLIQVNFDIPCGEEPIKATLRAPDAYEIWEAQELKKRQALAKALKAGLRGLPVDEEEWQAELARYTEEETRVKMAKDRPVDQAEQYARKVAGLRTIMDLLPKYLRDDKGQLLFPTEEEQADFLEIMTNDPEIMTLLMNKYVELSNKVRKVGDEVKN